MFYVCLIFPWLSDHVIGNDPGRQHADRGFTVKKLLNIFKNKSGATAIEYALIAALIAVAVIVGAGALGTAANDRLQNVANTITTP